MHLVCLDLFYSYWYYSHISSYICSHDSRLLLVEFVGAEVPIYDLFVLYCNQLAKM